MKHNLQGVGVKMNFLTKKMHSLLLQVTAKTIKLVYMLQPIHYTQEVL